MPDKEKATLDPTSSFGDELRKQREIRGISLKEIADSTKISKRYLEAIEKNDFAALPAPVFSRGFVREYARYLGLMPDEMVDRYMHFVRSDAERNLELPESLRDRSSVAEPTSNLGRNLWMAALALFVLTSVLWWFLVAVRKKSGTVKSDTVARQPSSVPSLQHPSTETTAQPAVTPVELTLNMKVRERSWITLQIDGQNAINDELSAGTEQVLRAKREFRFKTIGNAGGIDLVLNGTKLPPLGRSGAVIHDRVLTAAVVVSGTVGAPPSE